LEKSCVDRPDRLDGYWDIKWFTNIPFRKIIVEKYSDEKEVLKVGWNITDSVNIFWLYIWSSV